MMTAQEFLTWFRSATPGSGFHLDRSGALRCRYDFWNSFCPLTFGAFKLSGIAYFLSMYKLAAADLELSSDDCALIQESADYTYGELRGELLAACGLTEEDREHDGNDDE